MCVLGGSAGAAASSGGVILFTVNNNCNADIMCVWSRRGRQARMVKGWRRKKRSHSVGSCLLMTKRNARPHWPCKSKIDTRIRDQWTFTHERH